MEPSIINYIMIGIVILGSMCILFDFLKWLYLKLFSKEKNK